MSEGKLMQDNKVCSDWTVSSQANGSTDKADNKVTR